MHVGLVDHNVVQRLELLVANLAFGRVLAVDLNSFDLQVVARQAGVSKVKVMFPEVMLTKVFLAVISGFAEQAVVVGERVDQGLPFATSPGQDQLDVFILDPTLWSSFERYAGSFDSWSS